MTRSPPQADSTLSLCWDAAAYAERQMVPACLACRYWQATGHTARKDSVMNRIRTIHPIRRPAAVLAALAGALLALSAASSPAFARPAPPPGGPAGPVTVPPQIQPAVVSGGMPGWQITLIAVGAALAAAVIAVMLDRARAAHRKAAMPAA